MSIAPRRVRDAAGRDLKLRMAAIRLVLRKRARPRREDSPTAAYRCAAIARNRR
jgi:hypothetical protein